MGAVYLATDTHLGRQVAVKTMRPDAAADPDVRERFLRKARATAAIEHEHVIPVYAVGEHAGMPYLVMPLLKGESLDARLRRGAWPTLEEVCRIGREVAAGLAAAHAVGLIHRDVKPANVWIGLDGRAKLLDFGLARLAHGGEALTRTGVVVGTPSYMAPEQAAGGAVDHRTDLFSLGVLLYELATRRRPFTGDSVMAVLTALAVHNPPPAHETNPAAPVALSHLLNRLLAKNPAERSQSAVEVCDALSTIGVAHASGRVAAFPPVAPAGCEHTRVNRAAARLLLGAVSAACVLPLTLPATPFPLWIVPPLLVGLAGVVVSLLGGVRVRGRAVVPVRGAKWAGRWGLGLVVLSSACCLVYRLGMAG